MRLLSAAVLALLTAAKVQAADWPGGGAAWASLQPGAGRAWPATSSDRALDQGGPVVARHSVRGQESEQAPSGCALSAADGSTGLSSDNCVACHTSHGTFSHSHPSQIGYAASAGRGYGALRSEEEVAARGVRLVEGRVECVTCHSPSSPYQDHIALPAGAAALDPVDRRSPASYEAAPNWRLATAANTPRRTAGAVSPAPLCAACHAFAD